MTGREPFEPLGAQARWKTVYELLKKTPTGEIITYGQLGEILGLDPDDDRAIIRSAVRRAAREHEEHDKRAIDAVIGQGYRPVEPRANLELAQRQQKKAGRSLARGRSKAVNVDLNGVDPEVRKALEVVAQAFSMQMDFNRRFEGKAARLEQTIRDIADSQEQNRKQTAEEVAELRERLARLEGGKTTYTVHAKRWEGGWELHIEGVGVTQSRALNDAEAMARDYISLSTGAAPGSFAVDVIPEADT